MNLAFAGNQEIAYRVLKHIVSQGVRPKIVFFHTEPPKMFRWYLFPELEREHVIIGKEFKSEKTIEMLKGFDLDYLISVHFPYVYPKEILDIPEHGALNLHPSFLPYGRGWHTPTWAIWDGTPFGATLHFMDEKVDTGYIVHQKKLNIKPYDTADSLYQRVLDLELEVFKEAWPSLVNFLYDRMPQPSVEEFPIHKKKDIKNLQYMDLDQEMKIGEFLKKLRALSTNKIKEGAYFEIEGKRYRIQLRIEEE